MTGIAAALVLAGALPGAQPLPPPPQPPVRYVVRKDDTLIAVARRWFVDPANWPAVQRLNRIAYPMRLTVGSVLAIPPALLKSTPIAARVVAFRGPVTLGGRSVAIGSPVNEGSLVATGADASVTVELADGSRFSLPSQTRVGVVRLRRVLLTGDIDKVFTTAAGRGEWRASPAPTPGSRFMVTTPVSVSAVRGTGFRVGYDGDATVGVVEGTVGVSGRDQAKTLPLPKGQGVAVGQAGPGTPVALLAAPELIRGGRAQTGSELVFAVAPQPGAQSTVFEVGSDAGLLDRQREARGTPGQVRFPSLPDGSYFVRATSTDANGIDGFASTAAFERITLATSVPRPFGRGMRFAWSASPPVEGERARDYRFTLFADEAGLQPIIDEFELASSTLTVTNLAPGRYWWRVVMTKFVGGRAVTAVGDLQSFAIAKP